MSKIMVQTKQTRFPTAPDLYGLFFEDINRAGDSGLYPEMLRNRSFEDSIPPERCTLSSDGVTFTTPMGWSDQFNNGEGLAKWLDDVPPTSIPAWYADGAAMSLSQEERLNNHRLVALKVAFSAGGSVWNIGYHGIPLEKGKSYDLYFFAKAAETPARLTASLVSKDGTVQDEAAFLVQPGDYQRYDCRFTAKADDFEARFVLTTAEAATLFVGFCSLMPTDTYKGHGMRKDLMEMLEGLHAKFLRFPGGCIVEGFTRETAMRFPNTIGPVWERPSHTLMWHYRTTNGLGFHEYLQICEDLNLEPMYVLNCGLTCQGREPEFFEGDELEQLLQEAFDAIEYAIGDVSTPMGQKRAEAGHPAPFKLTYIEIGNENKGEEYFWRYKKFYNALKAKYPQIKYISNTHTEHDGLPTEIADEHYYNMPEFFAENMHLYDGYDRNGPNIFLGEYAVTVGKTATLHCALAESMFLLGVENNQDIVTTTAYAPLFQNVHYTAWYPNLIAFDNHRAFGIPTYHALSMLAANRGQQVVALQAESNHLHRSVCGLPGISAPKSGMSFRNATLNGKPVSISHQVRGSFAAQNGEYTSVSAPEGRAGHANDGIVFATLGNQELTSYTFEVEAKSTPDNPITFPVWCYQPYSVFRIDETQKEGSFDLGSLRCFAWTVDGSASKISEYYHSRHNALGADKTAEIPLDVYNTYKVVARSDGFDCYINGVLVHQAKLPQYPAVAASAAVDEQHIIVKVVNITGEPDKIELSLDCAVQPDYEVQLLCNDQPEAMNSLEQPNAVAPVTRQQTGAAQTFTYTAPAHSLNILVLQKQN